MPPKNQYQTKQRKELLAYLEKTAGQHFTANDVCDFFKSQGNPIGAATVYRHLEHMVDEGLLHKYIIDTNSPACFEYITEQPDAADIVCFFHCKCEKCGKLIHLHCDVLEDVQEHLLHHHGFQINPLRTVLYGICEECRGKSSI